MSAARSPSGVAGSLESQFAQMEKKVWWRIEPNKKESVVLVDLGLRDVE